MRSEKRKDMYADRYHAGAKDRSTVIMQSTVRRILSDGL